MARHPAKPSMLMPETGPMDRRAVRTLLRPGGPLDLLPGPVLLVGADGRLIDANDAGARLFESRREAIALTLAADTAAGGTLGFKLHDPDSRTTTDLSAVSVDEGRCWLLLGRDASLDHDLRNALVDSRQRYKDIIEISGDFGWETDADGVLVFLSTERVLGHDAASLIGRRADSLLAPDTPADAVSPFATREPIDEIEVRLVTGDGRIADVVVAAAPLVDDTGRRRGARGLARDVTEERAREAALARARNRERLMSYVVRAMHDEIDPSTMLDAAARAIGRALATEGCVICRRTSAGWVREAATGRAIEDSALDRVLGALRAEPTVIAGERHRVVAAATHWRQETNGAVVVWRKLHHPWTDDEVALTADVAAQIGIALAQVAAHERLEWLSTRDPLTGLLNRRTFVDRLGARIAPETVAASRATEGGSGPRTRADDRRPGVLAYVDLDNFKGVNDRLGHQAGDRALLRVAALLSEAVRKGDLVARLGGDEFGLWLDGASADVARARGEALLARVGELAEFNAAGTRPLGFSIGMAVWRPGSGETLDDLVSRADHAMYRVKHSGKGRVALSPGPGLDTDAPA